MSCSTINTNLDIEDIHGKDADFTKITDENRNHYDNFVFNIHTFIKLILL